jgi:WD40 repeat protein
MFTASKPIRAKRSPFFAEQHKNYTMMRKTILLALFLSAAALLTGQTPRLVVPMGHTKEVASVAFSPDGKYILTGSWDQTAKLWDLAGHELLAFVGHEGPILSVAFSPDGKQVLTGSEDGTAKLWDLTGKPLRTFRGHASWVFAVAFSPDGQSIITGSRDRTAKVWSTAGRLLRTLAGHESQVLAVAFSPDGQRALTGIHNHSAKLWDIASGQVIQRFAGHSGPVTAVSFSPDGQQILTASNDKTAQLWDVSSGTRLQQYSGHTEPVWQAVFSPNGQQILTTSSDKTAKLWDLSGRLIHTFEGHRDPVRAAAFAPGGQQVLTGSKDGTARLWGAQGQEIQAFRSHAVTVEAVAYSPDGQYLLAGSSDGTARVWDIEGRELRTLAGHTALVESVAFSPDGGLMLTGSRDGAAKIWDSETGKVRHTLPGRSAVRSVAFSPDGQAALVGSWDKTAKLWDLASGEVVKVFSGHADAVWSVAFSRDGQQILTGSRDSTAKLWDRASGDMLRTFVGHQTPVLTAVFTAAGQSILTGGWDGKAKRWDIHSGEMLQTFAEQRDDAIRTAALSHDGQMVLTGDREGELIRWDLSGREAWRLAGHADGISAAAFSPKDQFVLTGGADRTMKLWDTQTGQAIATLIAIGQEDWVVTAPSGHFDASPGAMRLMHFAVGLESVELEQLKDRYFEPGLLAKLLGMSLVPLRSVEAFGAVALYPELKAQLSADNRHLDISLEPREGGIGKLSFFVNGKEMIEDANPQREQNLSIDLSKFTPFYWPDGPSQLSLRVYSANNWLKSRALSLEYYPPALDNAPGSRGPSPVIDWLPAALPVWGKPSLHAIVVGTANYASEQLTLQFPDRDAAAFSQAIKLVAPKVFEERVYVTLLHTDAQDTTRRDEANKETIRQAFQEAAKRAKAQDVLILYFSGHGVNYGAADRSQFYYLTKDIANENLSDEAIRTNHAISSSELTEWIKTVPALKQVMIVDACHAGQVVNDLLASRKDVNTTQVRALDRLKDRTGMFILAGSAADKASYEATQYGQGLLTFSLLQGMSGLALAEGKRVDVMTLFQYSRDQVPELARGINGIQKPVPHFPNDASSFDIGIADGVKIPVAKFKPVFSGSFFRNDATLSDPLSLIQAMNDRLRSISGTGGYQAPLIFMEARNYPSAYSISADYTMKRNKVNVRWTLLKGGETTGEIIQANGRINALPALVDAIERQALKLVEAAEKEGN